ncbi:MAG: hypothetical protein HRU38_13015 [Saccharospirillaceae bacterium]|nr:hypothetical protein [Pseudomonadales bacterium]NRB79564.1 hypothetical protein [Saccharospirillaceae bacterium]
MQTSRTVRMTNKVSQHHRRNSFFNKHHDNQKQHFDLDVKRDKEHEPSGCIIRSGSSKPH